MILIIGGAYQGKQSYASKTYNLTDPDWKDGQTCTIEDLKTAKAVHHFHSFIRRELDEGGSVRDLAEIIWKENPDLIIVTDEVGYGIVPMLSLIHISEQKAGTWTAFLRRKIPCGIFWRKMQETVIFL